MNKKMTLAVCVSGLLAFSLPLFADESHNHDHGTPAAKAEKKPGRKKRELMCKDCGKPERICDCPEELKQKEREAQAKEKKAE